MAGQPKAQGGFEGSTEGLMIVQTYDEVASRGASDLCCSPVGLYDSEELDALPEETLALSSGCGHPVRFSQISTGASVVDVGSGAGGDCFLAARMAGPSGCVVGVDPSPTMRARAARSAETLGLSWVSFVDGTAEKLPIPDASVDVVISNCVLSLASHPEEVWREIGRILRPGGRFTVSDIVGGGEETLETKTRCETGVSWTRYIELLWEAGFSGIHLLDVKTASFRDGAAAVSATIRGRWGLDPPNLFVQLFHEGVPQEVLNCAAFVLVRAAEKRTFVCDLETNDLREEPAGNVFGLLTGEEPDASKDVDYARGRHVYVSANGRYLGLWDAVESDYGKLRDLLSGVLKLSKS